MSAAHTPGQWAIDWEQGYVHAEGAPIVAEPFNMTGPQWQTGQANARLIAAAPDLLAMLKEMTDLAETYGAGKDCDGNIIAARELIAKAEGAA